MAADTPAFCFCLAANDCPHAVLGSAGSVSRHTDGCETLRKGSCPLGRPGVNV